MHRMGRVVRCVAAAWVAILAAGAVLAADPDPALDARVHALAAQLRCLVCQNQTLADSDADLAVDLRGQIREQLRQGTSEEAVKDYLVQRYGDFVLYKPPVRPQTWLLWFGPLVLLIGTSVVIVRRRRRRGHALSGASPSRAQSESKSESQAGAQSAPQVAPLPAPASRPQGRPPRSRWAVAAALVTLPVAAAFLYFHLGNPRALMAAIPMQSAPFPITGDGDHSVQQAQIEAMVSRLAMRLRKTPDDPDGWYMLARSYGALGRFDDAAAAYAKAVALVPDAAALRADYADALASASGGTLEGTPLEQVRQALALDPDEPKALALAGTAAAERGDLREAIRYWEHLYRLLPSDSLTAMRVAANLAAAQSAMESAGQPTPAQAGLPVARPVTGPAERPVTQPVSQSANQSATQPAPRPAPQSGAQAVAQPSPDGPGLPRPQ